MGPLVRTRYCYICGGVYKVRYGPGLIRPGSREREDSGILLPRELARRQTVSWPVRNRLETEGCASQTESF
jgi:hypothetical protein